MVKNFLFLTTFIPVKNNVSGIRYEITPIDCKNISETKPPLIPRIFLTSVSFGKIKFGSSGE